MKIYMIVWQNRHGSNEYTVFSVYKDASKYQSYIQRKIKNQKTNVVMLLSRIVCDTFDEALDY